MLNWVDFPRAIVDEMSPGSLLVYQNAAQHRGEGVINSALTESRGHCREHEHKNEDYHKHEQYLHPALDKHSTFLLHLPRRTAR